MALAIHRTGSPVRVILGWSSFVVGVALALVVIATSISMGLGWYRPPTPGYLILVLLAALSAWVLIAVPLAVRYDANPDFL